MSLAAAGAVRRHSALLLRVHAAPVCLLRRFRVQKSSPGKLSPAGSNKEGRRGGGSLRVWWDGGKLSAVHQDLPGWGLKAHFLESLLVVAASVTGWMLPASRRFRALLDGLIASFPAGFTAARLMFSPCASRWTASEQSRVLSQQSRFMSSWEGKEGVMANGGEEHPFLSDAHAQTLGVCVWL